jgi:dCMP deaminase
MSRPSFHDIYMRLASLMSERGTCARTNSAGELMKVGCAIVSTDFRRVFSAGYNGNAAGLPNECDSTVPGACGCIHAEANAIVSCAADRDEPKIVFCTHLPCTNCAKLIIQLGGVREVYYRQDYRLKESLVLFAHPKVDISVGHLVEGEDKNQAQVRAVEARLAWEEDANARRPRP